MRRQRDRITNYVFLFSQKQLLIMMRGTIITSEVFGINSRSHILVLLTSFECYEKSKKYLKSVVKQDSRYDLCPPTQSCKFYAKFHAA